ncbi:nicotinate-nucleotide adenylyltransferase [Mycoplasmoides fastidiosum]|uniref:bis(5'-nucleosyl)-tetraphosphatase (symmetrical) n=1 Tax=Mycoplasmoides fastidiosum TaxID=92758 RepID=A0ABU0M054_9BACT|nr:bis(5'-nucleosyl)-tetraphosphatase (symmetrical) YqeK [Mycoplasmoides fastidiosum]MDQ0514228.1 nicotinate-nucleotide adenylyltransferase [Mycoplasmoides fastidiosum]UUD37365.1 bis(5'-nucleosyl)-tetraphosphatase (symmetrical) YqeK [Mycoplasmoides fastidiosum]
MARTHPSKIIVYSSAFDPISNFNIKIAEQAAQSVDADLVYLLPSYYGQYGTIHSASDQERIHMCRLAIPKPLKPRYLVSDYELQKKEKSNPYDTLEALKSLHPDAQFYLLVDYETLSTFSELYDAALIKSMVTFICYKNKDIDQLKSNFLNDAKIEYIDDDGYNPNQPPLFLNPTLNELNQKVIDYINQYGTYAKAQLKHMVSQERYQHCLAVADTAVKIAQIYNHADTKHDPTEQQKLIADAYIAGLYHDLCKELRSHDLIDIARNQLKIKWWPTKKVLHGPVAAWWLKHKYYLNNSRILSAVAQHTMPIVSQPDPLTKIVFLADRLEPKREAAWTPPKFKMFWDLLNNNQFEECYQLVKTETAALHESQPEPFVYPTKF